MKLYGYQQALISEVFGHWKNGTKRVLMQSGTGTGKCLVKGTRVRMFNGSSMLVEDIQVGDRLMGDDGQPRMVLSLATGSEMCYDIVPVKGEKWACNESHILSLKYIGGGTKRWTKGQVYDISVREYLGLCAKDKHCLKQFRVPVDYTEKTVPVDPYFLGVWLGDGTQKTISISNPEPEIIEYIKGFGTCYNEEKRIGKCPVWKFKVSENGELYQKFKNMGLFSAKYIPQHYKANSESVRLQVLAGIVDTDGYYGNGIYEVIAKSDTLANDIIELCQSLGLAAYKSTKSVKLEGWDVARDYNRIKISGDIDRIPCKVERKKAEKRRQIKNVLHTGFQVVPRGVEQYYGFEIDGNRRFLLGDFTVTHNTVMFNHIAALAHAKGHRVLIIADRRELIMQAWKRLFQASGIHAGIIMSGQVPAYHLPVQIASVQTLNRRSFPPDIDLVIIDECRGSVSPSYAPIFGQYKDAFFLGVDATPIRTNGQGFDHIYQALVHGPSIKEMEKAGALVPANVKVNPINQASLDRVKVLAGDYDEGELAKVMMGDQIMAGVVASRAKYCPGEKTIVFAVNVEHSKAVVAKYNEAGVKAVHVDGSFSIEDRNRAFKSFEQGDVEVLVNVGIATYGYDNPWITCVQLLRPTKSLALYLQMVGRGARTCKFLDGTAKQSYTILDHANCRIEHGAPNADRKWTLKGKGKAGPSKEDKKVKMIFADGKEKVVSSREIPQDLDGVTLVDMTDAELEGLGRRKKFDKIKERVDKASHKPIAAYFRFVSEVKDYTLEDLEYIQKKLNFKYGWASFKWKEKLEKEKKAAAA